MPRPMPLVEPVTTATLPASGVRRVASVLDLHVHVRALLWLSCAKDAASRRETEMRFVHRLHAGLAISAEAAGSP